VTPVPLVLDTDIGSDVDDALALAFAIRHPDIDLRAVTTVSGDTKLRARIARRLLELGGCSDVPVGVGVPGPTEGPRSRAWFGHEGVGLLDDDRSAPPSREGVDLLIEQMEGSTQLATIGALSNVAAAVDRDPSFSARVPRLVSMAGSLAPLGGEDGLRSEHNASVDPGATERAFRAGVPTLIVPFDVTARTIWREPELEALRRGDELCVALARLIDVWGPVLRELVGGDADEVVAGLHDPLTLAATVEPGFVRIERVRIRLERRGDGLYTVLDPRGDLEVDAVRDVDAGGFASFLLEAILG
jgi:purine nucleosidase